ncbi:MAG: PKD domain-containing protein, partial [Pyrinomonadaceae bacterium]
PTASLTATPTQGTAPLTVSFDGSHSSDPDAGDSVASYVFSFGDGTPDVVQSGPTVQHVYTQAGNYFATLRVRDGSATDSANVASATIVVQDSSAGVNYALQSNGGVASASSTYAGGRTYPAATANDGSNTGLNWEQGGGWNDNTRDEWPDWLQVDFSNSKTINEMRVYTLQDNFNSPQVPTTDTTCASYGLLDYDMQYWDGSTWVTVPNGAIRGNDKVIRIVGGLNITTTKIRINVLNARAHFSRIVEVEAYGPAGQ